MFGKKWKSCDQTWACYVWDVLRGGVFLDNWLCQSGAKERGLGRRYNFGTKERGLGWRYNFGNDYHVSGIYSHKTGWDI